ncbi:pentapeptide repeat-containing protein [Oscillatoria sp. CS-180]|nr:pentapeptide repeat-containing protein [Oscillatoria sp. CS-180]
MKTVAETYLPQPTPLAEASRIIKTRTCESCTLVEVDISEVDLSGALFKDSEISFSQLIRTSLVEVDLSNTQLYSTNMSGADLSRANLDDAILNGVTLDDANLTNTNLSSATIEGSFRNAILSGANFTNAQIRFANFTGSNLTNANFADANVTYINFINADLSNADLTQATFEQIIYDTRTQFPEDFFPPESGAYLLGPYSSVAGVRAYNLELADQDLTGIDFSEAQIEADFSGTILNNANFENAVAYLSIFTGASLIDVRFCNAQLAGINLTDANLHGADLRGANLDGAVINNTNLQSAIYNTDTQFPEGFDPAKVGAIFSDEASTNAPRLSDC